MDLLPARYILSQSVRPSITIRYTAKTAKPIAEILSPRTVYIYTSLFAAVPTPW